MNNNKPDILLELQKVNIDELEKEIDKLTDIEWGKWGWRQFVSRFPHGYTNSYPFIWSQDPVRCDVSPSILNFWSQAPVNNIIHISKYNQRTKIWRLVKEVIDCISKRYNGKIVKCMLVKLPSHTKISTHIDDQFSLVNSHRFHLPIKTNSDIIFYIDSLPYEFKRGQWYEINNQLPHGVENNSDDDRVHLIFDIMPFYISRLSNIKFKYVKPPKFSLTDLSKNTV